MDIIGAARSAASKAGTLLKVGSRAFVIVDILILGREIAMDLDQNNYVREAIWVCKWKPEIQQAQRLFRDQVVWALERSHWSGFTYVADFSRRNFDMAMQNKAEIIAKAKSGEITGAAIYALNFNESLAPESNQRPGGITEPEEPSDGDIVYNDEGEPIGTWVDLGGGRRGQTRFPQPDGQLSLPASDVQSPHQEVAIEEWEEETSNQAMWRSEEWNEYTSTAWSPTAAQKAESLSIFCSVFTPDSIRGSSARRCAHEAAQVQIFNANFIDVLIKGVADLMYSGQECIVAGITGITDDEGNCVPEAIEMTDRSISIGQEVGATGDRIAQIITSMNQPAASTVPVEGTLEAIGGTVIETGWNAAFNFTDDLVTGIASLVGSSASLDDDLRMNDECGKNQIRQIELPCI